MLTVLGDLSSGADQQKGVNCVGMAADCDCTHPVKANKNRMLCHSRNFSHTPIDMHTLFVDVRNN